MKNLLLFVVFQFISVQIAVAQDTLGVDDISKYSHYFRIEEGKLVGDGAQVLQREIEKSQFFVLGEEHFSAKISEFTNVLLPVLSESSFKHFALEIGRNSAEVMVGEIEKKGSIYELNTKINNLVGEVPIPFFDGKEDERFLKTALEKGFTIWGIDQEYLTSQVFLIDEIFRLSKSNQTTKPLYEKAKSYLIEETKKGRENRKYPLFTNLMNSKEIESYFSTIDSTSSPQSFRIVSDLRKSWKFIGWGK